MNNIAELPTKSKQVVKLKTLTLVIPINIVHLVQKMKHEIKNILNSINTESLFLNIDLYINPILPVTVSYTYLRKSLMMFIVTQLTQLMEEITKCQT